MPFFADAAAMPFFAVGFHVMMLPDTSLRQRHADAASIFYHFYATTDHAAFAIVTSLRRF